MNHQPVQAVQVTEHDKPSKGGKRAHPVSRSFSLSGLFGKKRSSGNTSVIPLPPGTLKQPLRPSVEQEKSGERASEANGSDKLAETAKREAVIHDHRGQKNNETWAVNNNGKPQSERSSTPQSEALQQNHRERNLWEEAWVKLSDDDRKQLEAPWRNLDANNSFEMPEASKGDRKMEHESNNHSSRATESRETDDSTVIKNTVDQVIDKTKKMLGDYQALSQTNHTAAVLFREKAKVVLVSALDVKDYIDVVLSFDPTGYGASAWTVVSFALTLVKNDLEQTDRVFAASEFLANVLARYYRIQKLSQQIPFEKAKRATTEFEDAIRETYVAILRYSAAVKRAADGSILTRIRDSFVALTGPPLEILRQAIGEKDTVVEKWRKLVGSEYEAQFQSMTVRSLDGIEKKADGIIKEIQAVHGDTTATKEKVEDLMFQSIVEKFQEKDDRHPKLRESIDKMWKHGQQGQRLIHHHAYTEWKAHPQSVLWLQGPASCGKSSFCSSVVEDLRKLFAQSEHRHKILVFWYFQATNSLETIGRSFLEQLCKDKDIGLSENTWRSLNSLSRQRPRASWDDLLPKIKGLIGELGQPIFIVLDGLDELPRRTKAREREQILELVTGLIKDGHSNLHILLASRAEHDIIRSLQGDAEMRFAVRVLNVKVELVEELLDFVNATMENDKKLKALNSEFKDRIRDALILREEMYFPWVASMLDELRRYKKGHEKDHITNSLCDVPRNMIQTYQQALASIKTDTDKQTVKSVLMWMLRHKRSAPKYLTEEELAAATTVRIDALGNAVKPLIGTLLRTSESTLHSIRNEIGSGGDIRNDDSDEDDDGDDDNNVQHRRYYHLHHHRHHHNNNADEEHNANPRGDDLPPRHFEFIHSSAQDYMEGSLQNKFKQRPEAQWFKLPDEEVHYLMGVRCLQVLLEKDEKNQPMNSALEKYAAQYWDKHYLLYDKAVHDETRASEVKVLETKGENIETRVEKLLDQGNEAFRSWLDVWDPDNEFVPSRLDKDGGGGDDDDDDDDNGDDDDDGSNDSKSDGSDYSHNNKAKKSPADPVYYVVKLGLLRLAVNMIKNKSQVKKPGREGNVLQLALHYKHWSVVDALLEHCDDAKALVTVRNGPHGTPLYIASATIDGKAEDMVAKLINKGAPVNETNDGKFGSPLHVAAYHGNHAVVRRLLQDGEANVNLEGGMFGTALQAAAARGHVDVVQLLLENRAKTTVVSGLLGTALQAALTSGSDSTARKLQEAVNKTYKTNDAPNGGPGWSEAIDRLDHSNNGLLVRYTSLFPTPTDKGFQMPSGSDLEREQDLVAKILDKWFIPASSNLDQWRQTLVKGQHEYPYESPAAEQLREILRALPNFEGNLRQRELNRPDFRHKALFWSGINYILESLPLMIEHATKKMEHAFVSAANLSIREHKLLTSCDGIDSFGNRVRIRRRRPRWFNDFSLPHESFWSRTSSRDSIGIRSDMPSPYLRRGGPSVYFDHRSWYRKEEVDMDLSDKLVIETARQQQLLQQRLNGGGQRDGRTEFLGESKMRVASMHAPMQLSRLGGEDATDASSDDGDRDDGESNNNNSGYGGSDDGDSDMNIHLVVDNILCIVKELVEFGKLCDQLHAAATQRSEHDEEDDSVVQTVQDLTFEVFTALVRLAVSIRAWRIKKEPTTSKESTGSQDPNAPLLEQTVHLLKTVRLARLSKLAASATEHLHNGDRGKSDRSNASAELEPAPSDDKEGDGQQPLLLPKEAVAEIAAAVVEQLVREHLSVLSFGLSSQRTATAAAAITPGELPRLVQNEVAPVLDAFRQKMYEQIGDLVRDAVRHETAGGGGSQDINESLTREDEA